MSSFCIYIFICFLFFFYIPPPLISSFFFFNDTATTEIYTLSLHDALPICDALVAQKSARQPWISMVHGSHRSEEHTSELQSHLNLVCRLLLEKKKKKRKRSKTKTD